MSKMNHFPTSDEKHIVIRCKLKLTNEPKFRNTILKSIAGLANTKGGFIFFEKIQKMILNHFMMILNMKKIWNQ